MEPKQASPNLGPEMPLPPNAPELGNGAQNPNLGPNMASGQGYEVAPNGYEQLPSTPERGYDNLPAPGEIAPLQPLAPPTNVVTPPPVAQAPPPPLATSSALPTAASDDDLIEKEWVEQAKKVIAETKDDPYKREKEIKKIQLDYIRKRYGREIGDSGD